MTQRTPEAIILSFFVILVCLLPVTVSALIEVYEGNEPAHDMGWPTGTKEVANLPSRLGYMVGPPFGGGEYYFKYRCKSSDEFNSALQKFSAIRVPRMSRHSLISLDGQRTQVFEDKPLLLVAHDFPKDKIGQVEGEGRADWTFTVWVPESFHNLFSKPDGVFDSDHPNYRQPVPPPRIDVYVGNGSPIEWEKVEVPPNVRVIDKRMSGAPVNTADGGVIRGGVYNMGTHQIIPGASVTLVKQTDQRRWEKVAQANTDDSGSFEIRAIPEGYYEMHISAEGYAARNAGVFDNRSGHAYHDFDALLIGEASFQGVVVDKRQNPIAGVAVYARETLGVDGFGYKCTEEPSATTDDEGRFVLRSLPRGYTHIRCQAQSLHQETSTLKLYKVGVRQWEKPEEIKIIMSGTGIVQGKVIGKDGEAPTRQFAVELEPKGGHEVGSWGGSMYCKEDGRFKFEGVPSGEYFVIAKPDPMREGEASEPKPVVVTTGKTVELEIISDYAHERKR